MFSNRRRAIARVSAAVLALALSGAWPGSFDSSASAASPGLALIKGGELRDWLSYIASDELEGRATYSAGLGLAAAYIQDHLRAWGVKPAGDGGSYLQTVSVLGVRSTNRSSVIVQVGGQSRTFRDGEGVTFPRYAGGPRRFTVSRVEFAGYGLDVPTIDHTDLRGKDLKGAAVVWLGQNGPRGLDSRLFRMLDSYRDRYVTDGLQAAAIIGPERPPSRPGTGSASGDAASRTGQGAAVDFTTTRRLDLPRAPALTGSDGFYAFLFSRAPVTYSDLKRRADAQEPLPSFALNGVALTFTIDVDYQVVRTQLTQNVVGLVEGADPQLKSTYVAFGAHYDHLGYSEGEPSPNGAVPPPPFGRPGTGPAGDRIWNGADDDGSGTVAVMELAHAFAAGPRPKRSLLFIWHAGEELGTYGSLYFVDHPTVPLDRIVAQLNIDMIGRNRDDDPAQSNTVYLVGSDRISTELDQIAREADRGLPSPLTLDYEMNDLSDPEQIYYRSDHYSYAAKGIPIIFFTTGLHADYHASSDEVPKILFDKLERITGLVYETGARLANLDHPPARDNRGPRAGTGTR